MTGKVFGSWHYRVIWNLWCSGKLCQILVWSKNHSVMSRSKHFPVIQMPWNLLLHDLSLNSGLPSMTVMALHVTSNGKYRLPFDLPLLSTQFPTQFTFSSDSLVRSQFQREFFSLSSPTHAAKKLPYFTSSAKRS